LTPAAWTALIVAFVVAGAILVELALTALG